MKFIIISLSKSGVKRSFSDKIMMRHSIEKYLNKMIEKKEFRQHEITIMGKHGVEVELPFVEEEIKNMEKAYLESNICKILDIYDIPGCYLSRELNFLYSRFNMNKKWILNYLLFPEALRLFLEKCEIPKEEARIVLIDSGNQKMETILQGVLEFANYLTIVTNRVEYFGKAIDIVYDETGLMMEIKPYFANEPIAGNLIINLDTDSYQLYSLFEMNACVIDLEFTNTKLNYLANRRKDLKILYDYEITAAGEQLDKELIAEVLVRDNWKISRFAKQMEVPLTAEELSYMAENYQIEIKNLKMIMQV